MAVDVKDSFACIDQGLKSLEFEKIDNDSNCVEVDSEKLKKVSSIIIPSRQYLINEKVKILLTSQDTKNDSDIKNAPDMKNDSEVKTEALIMKIESFSQSKPGETMAVLNLMDIDVGEVKAEVDKLCHLHQAQNLLTAFKQFMAEHRLNLDEVGKEFYEQIESYMNYLSAHYIPMFLLRDESKVHSEKVLFEKNLGKYFINDKVYANLTEMISSLSVKNTPEYLSHYEEKIKVWKSGIRISFNELLDLMPYFSFVDFHKLHDFYTDNPGMALKAIKSKAFIEHFDYCCNQNCLNEVNFSSAWMDLPNDLEKICEVINSSVIVFREEYIALSIALKPFKIRPFLGVTWPYIITTLLASSSNGVLKKFYPQIASVSNKRKYKVNFEDYNSSNHHIKYFVR
jgi:hypothetical protein